MKLNTKRIANVLLVLLCSLAWAQEEDPKCAKDGINYNDGGFASGDFVGGGQGLLFGDTIAPDQGGEINTEEIVFPTNQPFIVDYLSEGAGASHTLGFFFLDIDTNKNGFPDFFETGDNDDLDGDGLVNSEDDDIDGDGIANALDTAAKAGVSNSSDPSLFRNGTVAAAAGETTGDYWEFVPSYKIDVGGEQMFEHPGAYLYVDDNDNDIPDVLEYEFDTNEIPPMALDKGYATKDVNGADFPGLLGRWFYTGSGGGTGAYHWIGSTIFYIADDDSGTGVDGNFSNYSPYTVTDASDSTNAQPDYLIYGTTDVTSAAIPDEVKGTDGLGEDLWRYRWYEGTVSGGREYAFFLTVYYHESSFESHVNTYYSKSGFNLDSPPATPNRNGATSGDKYGGWDTSTDWYPNYRNEGNHDTLAQAVFGQDWFEIVDSTAGYPPVAFDSDNQAWVDEWENYTADSRIVQYRGLADWFSETLVDSDAIINGRYGIDMSAEGDSSLIRAINGNMAHLMVGAPAADPEAWLLGWEDLFSGGDRDFEDVVFYVKREASGNAQSFNVASGLDRFEDVSLTTIKFEFKDNFTDDKWGEEGTYINYFYRLSTVDDWIPLLGGEHLRDPDLFVTEVNGGEVTRKATIQLDQEGARELYWMVEMKSADTDSFVPEVNEANVEYEALIHDIFFNSALISSSNVDYFGALETPDFGWNERGKNRGHVYAIQAFDHGPDPSATSFPANFDFLDYVESQPPTPFLWDAGVTMKDQSDRTIYAALDDGSGGEDRYDFSKTGVAQEVIDAFDLSNTVIDGEMKDNFHNPASTVLEPDLASTWLVNWVHGYNGAISDGTTTIEGSAREWFLGGINRSTVSVVRAPGDAPTWLRGSGVPVATKQDYAQWADESDQEDTATRLLVGSEAGMLHAIDAGQWLGRKCDPLDVYADGCYVDYGTGAEVWALIPNNLLDDMKFNYTGRNSVSAKIDSTPITGIIREGSNWKRLAIVSQGENGGRNHATGTVGSHIWALDITEVDNPIPLWEFTDPSINNIIHPLAMTWSETSGGPRWLVGANSGMSPVAGQKPHLFFLDAYDGSLVFSREVGSIGDTIGGAPAMIDTDGNGYTDWAYAATSGGMLVAQSLSSPGTVETETISGARFFLTPNVAPSSGGKTLVIAISGDSPLVDDEIATQPSVLYAYTHDTEGGTGWELLGTFEFPRGHKAFARPRLVGSQLVVGTTTGETFSFCDPDPDDPGNLYLFDDVFSLDSIDPNDPSNTGLTSIINFGSVRAPITVNNGNINAFSSFQGDYGLNNKKNQPNIPEELLVSIGNVFGVVGWSEPFLDGNF